MTDNMWLLEEEAYASGETAVCGVDEAGRGPLAGPVYAAAVVLPRGLIIPGLDDSKKLTAKKREELFDIITESAVAYGISSAAEKEIDELNILNATYLAMNRAMEQIDGRFSLALIDGNRKEGIKFPCSTITGGDGKSESIAAASVLAKVSRDWYMEALSEQYPEYSFQKHKGYGTKEHYAALREYGPRPVHRLTFLKKLH